LRRAIQRHIEDALSEKILYKHFTAGQIIVVDAEDDPENEGKRHIVFNAVEGIVAPSEAPLAGDTVTPSE
jgi:ATP-dependent Clp protease ATP-binding subunit ClpC